MPCDYVLVIFQLMQGLIMSSRRVFVVGVGLTKFEKPETKQWDYPDMGKEAGRFQGLPWLRICCSQHFSQMEKVGAK